MSGIKVDEKDPNGEQFTAPYMKLYTNPGTPNGTKLTILLHLLGIKDTQIHIRNMPLDGEQKEEWFLEKNPNGKIPVLSDVGEDGKPFYIMESAAVMVYITDKLDKERKLSYGVDDGQLYYDQLQWLIFQVASQAPILGQAGHFLKYATEDIPYAKKRFLDEAMRGLGVVDRRLKQNNGWLVGDKLNIADISAYAWIRLTTAFGFDLSGLPHLEAWLAKLNADEQIKAALK